MQRVDEEQALTMRIPLHFINEEKCIGVKQDGGVISHLMTEIEIVCLPKDLPEYLDVDMLEVGINETLHLTDIKLPEGVQPTISDRDFVVATIVAPTIEVEETKPEEEEETVEGETLESTDAEKSEDKKEETDAPKEAKTEKEEDKK